MAQKSEDIARGKEISERVARLEAYLNERGASDWAIRVDHAEAGGSTGTEILVRLSVVLRELRKTGDAKRLGIDRDVSDLAGLIDRQLRL